MRRASSRSAATPHDVKIAGDAIVVAITAGGRWAAVADHGDGGLLVFDTRTRALLRTIAVGAGPHRVWAVPR